MYLKSYEVLSLLGYITILNEEMHSHQIKLLNFYIEVYSLEAYRNSIFDIINDVEDKVEFNCALKKIQEENVETQYLIYRMCYALALIDCDNGKLRENIDEKERSILSEIKRYIYIDITKCEKQALKEAEAKKKEFGDQGSGEKFDLDFKKIYRIAKNDYEVWNEAINNLVSSCDLLGRQISNLDIIENKQLNEVLDSFKEKYDEQIFSTVQSLKGKKTQKELASRNFALALMGRTKAGKSTLHSLMCGEGAEFIGKGKQRTTRFNRVFSWKGIKIIDTPGIGAGESAGEKDTEIACRVISQADIICFVVADDSITEEILSLIDKIAEYHKPMIILLNHKDDINKKSHLKTFEKNPNLWLNTTNEQRLDGWIGRLERNAEKKGYLNRICVVPVFLLAAIKGVNENNDMFLRASNYYSFIESIKSMIEDNCMIYKSQTLLDEPSIQFFKANEVLKSEKRQLTIFKDKVDDIKFRTNKSIIKLRKEIVDDIKRYIDTEFEAFFTSKSNAFVEECFEIRNVFEIQRKYEGYVKSYLMEEKVTTVAEEIIENYRNKISGIIKEIDLEIEYAHINSFENNKERSIDGIHKPDRNIPFKGIFKTVSILLDVAAIWYPALAIISIPMSFISGFFKSSAQKAQLAKNQAKENFKKLVDYQKKDYEKKLEKELLKVVDSDSESIGKFLASLDEQVLSVIGYINGCINCIEENIQVLNVKYAIRLLEYLSHDKIDQTEISIKRDYIQNNIEIRTRKEMSIDTKLLKKVTGENILIRRTF